MKLKFLDCDERIYDVYSGKSQKQSLCPFEMMTATADNPKGQVPETNVMEAGDIDDVCTVFVGDCVVYMSCFTKKAQLETDAMLRHDGIIGLFSEIDNYCFEAVRIALLKSECLYTYETVACEGQDLIAAQALEVLNSERKKLRNKFDSALNGETERKDHGPSTLTEKTDIQSYRAIPVDSSMIHDYEIQLSDLDHRISEAQIIVQKQNTLTNKSQTVSEVLNTFKNWIQFFYLPGITEADVATSKLSFDLKKMYGTGMTKMFDDLYINLVREACEVDENDLWGDECDEPLTLIEKQAQKFIAGLNNPGGFVKNWKPIVEQLCKWFVGRYHSDKTRKAFLDKYLIHIKICLDRCVELSCAELPGINHILKNYITKEFEKMKLKFLDCDERIYDVYSDKSKKQSLCPFEMMTATIDNPKGQVPKTIAMKGGDIYDLCAVFVDDCIVYMSCFANKAKLNTDAMLRHDGIIRLFSEIDNQCFEAVRIALLESECSYTYETVACDSQALKAAQALEVLKSERKKLSDKLESALNGEKMIEGDNK